MKAKDVAAIVSIVGDALTKEDWSAFIDEVCQIDQQKQPRLTTDGQRIKQIEASSWEQPGKETSLGLVALPVSE